MWALYDRADIYALTVYHTKNDAMAYRDNSKFLRDARWAIMRIEVRELPRKGKR